MKRLLLAALAVAALGALAGCGSDGSGARTHGAGFGTVNLLLTDAPADYEHVYLDVREVWIRGDVETTPTPPDTSTVLLAGGGDDDGGSWIRLDITPVVVDLLTLRNGVFLGLASGPAPSGHYTEVRLVLGPQNAIVVDGVLHDLKVPSGTSSGFKLKGSFDVPPGGTVDVGMDFDAARSIVHTGSDKYLLKPVVRVYPIQVTGSITGEVDPDDFPSSVLALSGPDTVATTVTDAEGRFKLAMLLAGSYQVCVVPSDTAYADTCLAGVLVTAGLETALGTITLEADTATTVTEEGWASR